jgi:hypothetical protein
MYIDDVLLQVKVAPTFDSIGLKEDLLRGIYAYNFEKPSAIQQRGMQSARDFLYLQGMSPYSHTDDLII